MEFKDKIDLLDFLNYNCTFIGEGAVGSCYLDNRKNIVYKIFIAFLEEDLLDYYTKEYILRFKDIKNKTFIFSKDVITIDNKTVGYTSPYIEATNLYKLNPLDINLKSFIKKIDKAKEDIKTISEQNIKLYDVCYNILLGKRLYVTDYDEFDFYRRDIDIASLTKINNYSFDIELYWFLIDNYFDEFVESNKLLKEMYCNKDVDFRDFLKLFRKLLNEYMGKDIKKLDSCKKCLNKKERKIIYQRQVL